MDTKRPRGRPTKDPGAGARVGHSLRIKPSTDRIVRAAADKNSRSIAEEIEYRLNQTVDSVFISFSDDSMLDRIHKDAAYNYRDAWEEARAKIRNAIHLEDTFQYKSTYITVMRIIQDIAELEFKTGTSIGKMLDDHSYAMSKEILDMIGKRISDDHDQHMSVSRAADRYKEMEERKLHDDSDDISGLIP